MSEAEKLITAWAWTVQTQAAHEAEHHRSDPDLTAKRDAVERAMLDLARRLEP